MTVCVARPITYELWFTCRQKPVHYVTCQTCLNLERVLTNKLDADVFLGSVTNPDGPSGAKSKQNLVALGGNQVSVKYLKLCVH